VPSISNVVIAWIKSFMDLADDEANAAWTDELLEKLTEAHGLKLMIEVNPLSLIRSVRLCLP
jgi:hypothetical protein